MIRVPRRLQDRPTPGFLTDSAGDRRSLISLTIFSAARKRSLKGWKAVTPADLLRCPPRSPQMGGHELADTLGADEYGYEFTEWHLDLRAAVAQLTDRERRLLRLRFYGSLTQAEIASEMGLSQVYIRRLLTATIGKLRAHLLPEVSSA